MIERNLTPFQNILDKNAPQTLLFVEAPEGYGKTTLLQQIKQWCTSNSTPCVYVDFNQTGTSQQLKPEKLLREISRSCHHFHMEKSEKINGIIGELRNIIRPFIADAVKSAFNREDIISFCFSLGVNHEDLGRQNHAGLIEEFLLYVERNGRQEEFLSKLKQERPNVDWSIWYWKTYLIKGSDVSKYEDIADFILQSLDIYSLETTLNRTARLLKEGMRFCKQQNAVLLVDSLNPTTNFKELWDWLENSFVESIARTELPFVAVIAGQDLTLVKSKWSQYALEISPALFTIDEIKKLTRQQSLYLSETELAQLLANTNGVPKKVVLALEIHKSRKQHFAKTTIPDLEQHYSQHLLELMPLVEEILQFQPKEIKDAFIACAIPHQFDRSILASLLGLDRKKSERVFNRISESPLTHTNDGFCGYDSEVRNFLLERAKEQKPSFFALNLHAVSWFLTKLSVEVGNDLSIISLNNLSDNIEPIFSEVRRVIDYGYHLKNPEAVGYLAEALYHLLIIDNVSAFTCMQEMFLDLEAYGRFSSCRYILTLLTEQRNYLTEEQIRFVDYYHCRLNINNGEWHSAETSLMELSQKPLPESLHLEISDALVSLLLEMGKGKEALVVCQEVEQVVTASAMDQPLKETWIKLNNSKAKALRLCGMFEDAIEQYSTALQIAQEEHMLPLMADTLLKIGHVYRDLGEWNLALEYCHQALNEYQTMNHAIGTINTFIALGNIYQTQGNWEFAEENYHKALLRFEDLEEDSTFLQAKAVIFANFAEIHIKQGEWEKASRTLATFEQISEDLANQPLIAASHLMKGKLCKEQGKWEDAVGHYNMARNIHNNRTGSPVELGNVLAELSEVYRLRSMLSPAVRFLDEALRNWRPLI